MEEDTARPRKKQRVGGVPSPAAAATSSTRARFAFGSRLPGVGTSLLKGPKSSGKAKIHTSTRMRHDHVRGPIGSRKRGRSVSRDEDEAASRTKPSHRPLTVKTALPLHGSHLPAPTKVSELLSGSHLHTISPAIRHKKRRSAEQQGLVADLAITEPAFWIKRRKDVEAALKELDTIEKRIRAISK